tara:strand:+ start:167 stop:382 length:216 start_codon:yes stop_codon:yes gene_type:complete
MQLKAPKKKTVAKKPRVQGISFPNGGIEKLDEICEYYGVNKSEAVRQMVDIAHVSMVKAREKAAIKKSVKK